MLIRITKGHFISSLMSSKATYWIVEFPYFKAHAKTHTFLPEVFSVSQWR